MPYPDGSRDQAQPAIPIPFQLDVVGIVLERGGLAVTEQVEDMLILVVPEIKFDLTRLG
jgi:hypothetical protein